MDVCANCGLLISTVNVPHAAADTTGVRATSGDGGSRGVTVCRLCETGAARCGLGNQAALTLWRSGGKGGSCGVIAAAHLRPSRLAAPPRAAGKYCERVALPYVFKYLVSELAAMNIRCSLDLK
jgi:hypothetical protein